MPVLAKKPPLVVLLSCFFELLHDFPNFLKICVLHLQVMHGHEMIYNQCICNIIFVLQPTDFLSIAEAADGTAGTLFRLFKQISKIVCYQ